MSRAITVRPSAMPGLVDVSVVVVTYNSAPCVEGCVASVLGQQGVSAELIVVDNHSADDTVAKLRHRDAGLQVLANQENIGFGRACNQGFESSHGRFVFFLNPDARLEQPDALQRLCCAMEQHPSWGLAGTRILSSDGLNESEPATSYPSQRHCRRDFSTLPGKIAWVMGASMMVHRDVFASLKGFDPAFFLYSEETDLCLRVRQLGREIGFVPDVTVRHIGQASERGNDRFETRLRSMTGLLRFWAKHYPDEDVQRLVRRDWLRASFRREWYAMMARFSGPESRAWAKHREYAAVSEASRRFLSARPFPQPQADRIPVRTQEMTK